MRTALFLLIFVSMLHLGCSDAPSESVPPTRQATSRATPATTRASVCSSSAKRLLGTWFAKDQGEDGRRRHQAHVPQRGADAPRGLVGHPVRWAGADKTGSYEVRGDVISSEAIRGGTSVNYSFDGDDLIIRYKEGKTVRFKRQ